MWRIKARVATHVISNLSRNAKCLLTMCFDQMSTMFEVGWLSEYLYLACTFPLLLEEFHPYKWQYSVVVKPWVWYNFSCWASVRAYSDGQNKIVMRGRVSNFILILDSSLWLSYPEVSRYAPCLSAIHPLDKASHRMKTRANPTDRDQPLHQRRDIEQSIHPLKWWLSALQGKLSIYSLLLSSSGTTPTGPFHPYLCSWIVYISYIAAGA